MNPSPTLVLYAHAAPRRSRVNRPIAAALAQMPHIVVHDLYRMYPDYDIDIAHEQRALEQAQTVVFQYPLQWYAPPALLKAWLDEVLQYGWAYGTGGTALRGKRCMVVASTGGQADSYRPDGLHAYGVAEFLRPMEQTAVLCGMAWLPPLVLHDAHYASQEAIDAHVKRVCESLRVVADTAPATVSTTASV
jgi:glutathione-regulated potassium-efflux system ancillary protein KefF